MLTVTVKGLDQLHDNFKAFSDRRFAAAVATAATRTAVKVKAAELRTVQRVFDRPTPYTLGGMFVTVATAQKPSARVWFKDDRAVTKGGTPATNYLLPNVDGTPRRAKRLEKALRAIGALPSGWFVTPGQGARLDAHGNVDRGQIVQVLSQLRVQLLAGSSRNMSYDARKQIRAQQKAGGRFFVIKPGAGVQPGVYQREFNGRNITPVFVFVRTAKYQRRFDFYGVAADVVQATLPDELAASFEDHARKLRAKRVA